MAEYFIGTHIKFDDEKYARDFTDKISGMEFCNFESKEEIEKMLEIAQRDKFKIGIHFPLNKDSFKYRDTLPLSLEEKIKEESFDALEKEIKYASEIGAEYILIHFPKPMVVDKSLAWDICRFAHDGELMDEKEYPFDIFKKNCHEALDKLSKLSKKYGITVVLELDMLNKYFYEGNLLEELMETYSNVKLCLDSARMHVVDRIDRNFDLENFVRKMAKYTYSLHISNIRVTDKIEGNHSPVSKTLKPEDGWGDTGRFLEIVSSENKDLKVLFEHRSDILSNEELKECYDWVMGFLN